MASKPGFRYAETDAAIYISRQLEALKGHKSQVEIADEVGYNSGNIISMFKTGATRIPYEKVPVLAKALNVDPRFLFRLVLQSYYPELAEIIDGMFKSIVSDNEVAFLDRLRKSSGNTDPELTPAIGKRLDAIFK